MKTEKPKSSKKNWIIAGLVGLGLLAAVVSATAGTTSGQDILITDHDSVYDYLFSNGRWYTRKKGATEWIDMLTALSEENYNLAMSRLAAFMNK